MTQYGLLPPQSGYGLLGYDEKQARLDAFLNGLGNTSAALLAAGAPSTDPGNFGRNMAKIGPGFAQGFQGSMQNSRNRAFQDMQANMEQQKFAMQQKKQKDEEAQRLARERFATARAMGGKDMAGQPVNTDALFAQGYPEQYGKVIAAGMTPEKPKLPSGMRIGATGRPEWIPGYLEGQAQIFQAKSTAGMDNWKPDPQNPAVQVNLTTGERKPAPLSATQQASEKSAIEAASEAKKNEKVFKTFEASMNNLEAAMGKTDTGPFVGALPAVTASAQTAEGAVATIAPVLKNLFRSAGEGIFTDKDQELLLDMVPKRTDHPEARKAKIKMINDVVRAKLGMEKVAQNSIDEPTPEDGSVQDGNEQATDDFKRALRSKYNLDF